LKVLVQWTLATPRGWDEVDAEQWRSTPRRPEPRGGETLDDEPGWVYRLCVQGVEFTADHYAVTSLPGRGCRVVIWNDDPEDYVEGERYARVWDFLPLRSDPRFRGAYNTRQSQVIFAESIIAERMKQMGALPEIIRPFSEFVSPDERDIRHGIWVPQALNLDHNAARPERGWREWSEGVPRSMLDERGHVKR
jgi:hypothetical protein